MKRIALFCLITVLMLTGCLSASAYEPSALMSSMIDYLMIGTGDFSQYDMATYMSARGYEPTDVVFDFELCPENQMIRLTCGQDPYGVMIVSTSHPEKILSAFVTLLPYFEEIQSSLPDGYSLVFRVYNGEVRSKRYAIVITKDNYGMYQ